MYDDDIDQSSVECFLPHLFDQFSLFTSIILIIETEDMMAFASLSNKSSIRFYQDNTKSTDHRTVAIYP